MKTKILNALLVVTSLFGYLEWGKGNHMFLFQAEGEILTKVFTDTQSIIHPFTVLPLLGQILLMITLFQKTPNRWLTIAGIAGIGLLLGLMFFIGALGTNWKILLSTIPFMITVFLVIRHQRKRASQV
jgi:peptidoglycan/LPS O-acetylase OafA/YrhL